MKWIIIGFISMLPLVWWYAGYTVGRYLHGSYHDVYSSELKGRGRMLEIVGCVLLQVIIVCIISQL